MAEKFKFGQKLAISREVHSKNGPQVTLRPKMTAKFIYDFILKIFNSIFLMKSL